MGGDCLWHLPPDVINWLSLSADFSSQALLCHIRQGQSLDPMLDSKQQASCTQSDHRPGQLQGEHFAWVAQGDSGAGEEPDA